MLQDNSGVGSQQQQSQTSTSSASSLSLSSPTTSTRPASSRFAAGAAAGFASLSAATSSNKSQQSQTQSTLADSLRALRENNHSSSSLRNPAAADSRSIGSASSGGGRRKAPPSNLQHSSSRQSGAVVQSPTSPVSPPYSPLESESPRTSADQVRDRQTISRNPDGVVRVDSAQATSRDRSTSGPAASTSSSTSTYAYAQGARKTSAPALSSPKLSPPQTPTAMATPPSSTSKPSSLPEASSLGVRRPSAESTSSSTSKNTADIITRSSSSQRSQDHQDLAAFITAAGSPQTAIESLWKERQNNEQLWRLVEKQRAMILGLNKDLERALRDKERYRRKLKEHTASKDQPQQEPQERTLSQKQRTAPLANGEKRTDSALDRMQSRSPPPGESFYADGRDSTLSEPTKTHILRTDSNISAAEESPRDNKSSLAASQTSSTPSPKDAALASSTTKQARKPDGSSTRLNTSTAAPAVSLTQATPTSEVAPTSARDLVSSEALRNPPPASPPATTAAPTSPSSATSPTSTRKAPPAPLNLSKTVVTSSHLHSTRTDEHSDSDYDDVLEDGEAVPPIMRERGRRKTREEDDALREAIAHSEGRSKSSKKAKSKTGSDASSTKPPMSSQQQQTQSQQQQEQERQQRQLPPPQQQQTASSHKPPHTPGFAYVGLPASPRMAPPDAAGSINALLSPAASDTSNRTGGQGSLASFGVGSTPLMSPGLPSSPRPMQVNAPQQPVGLPMSPRDGKFGAAPLSARPGVGAMGGMPLSPRAPRQAIPMPPATPLGPINPHLQRAEQHAQGVDPGLRRAGSAMTHRDGEPPLSPKPSVREREREPPSSPKPSLESLPDGVYQGLRDDRWPKLLLPPNALPSIDAKVYSGRMRPSRNSMLMSKWEDDPVFQLGIHARSDGRQLWRVEKTAGALDQLHHVFRDACPEFKGHMPERSLFSGHAPAKIDTRRQMLNEYFDLLLDTEADEHTALVVCSFFSRNVIEPDNDNAYAVSQGPARSEPPSYPPPPTPGSKAAHSGPKMKQRKEGYLTKRGKNFGGWKARYFVLDGSTLAYYDAPGGEAIGRIQLSNAQIGKQQTPRSRSPGAEIEAAVAGEDNEYRHAFLVLEPKRKDEKALVRHVLCAESDEERDAWVEALLMYVEDAPGGGKLEHKQSTSSEHKRKHDRSRRGPQDHLPPRSRGHDGSTRSTPEVEKSDAFQSYSYDKMAQQHEPVRVSHRNGPSSPTLDSAFPQDAKPQKTISGPSGATKIQDASLWGNKLVPPTSKEKKRSIFGFRGRSSSDLDAGQRGGNAPHHPGAGHPVFGVPLAEAVEATRPIGLEIPLPSVVFRCIEYMKDQGAVEEEGIFRLSGSNVTIKALKDRFNTEGDVKLLEGEYYDVHAVASLLKAYLRELPVSVLTRELHLDFLNVLKREDVDKVKAFNVLAHRLPPENFALVQTLASFLIEIVTNQDVNKMNVRNIAIVFGPTLNIPGPIITSFLHDFDAIFGDPVEEEQASPIRESLLLPRPQDKASEWDGIRSPRHQMFGDLPTPAYNQTGFQGIGGFAHMQQQQQPPQSSRQMHQRPDMSGIPPEYQLQHQYMMQQQQQSESSYNSLNAAFGTSAQPPPQSSGPNSNSLAVNDRDLRKSRRESNMQMLSGPGYAGGVGGGPQGLVDMLNQQRRPSYNNLRTGSDDGRRESPARRG